MKQKNIDLQEWQMRLKECLLLIEQQQQKKSKNMAPSKSRMWVWRLFKTRTYETVAYYSKPWHCSLQLKDKHNILFFFFMKKLKLVFWQFFNTMNVNE